MKLEAIKPTGTKSFLERRELVAANIGGAGKVVVGANEHDLGARDMIYVGMGEEVSFSSSKADEPAKFYLLSAPAHHAYPTNCSRSPGPSDSIWAARRHRTSGPSSSSPTIETCQIAVGMTQLAKGSVWNTMPPHVHDRRMEAYLYFDLDEKARVFHFMGEPDETRHIVMANEEAVLSPAWSIHSGCGTSNYAFIWAMAGDNVDYSDVDPVAIGDIR